MPAREVNAMLEDPFGNFQPQPGSRFWSWTLLAWLVVLALFAAALVAISGCATQEETVWHRICYEQYLGKDERGLLVVRHFCVKPEEVE